MVLAMNGYYSPYMPYMMAAIQPVTLDQYRNNQRFTTSLMTDQINFLGKINPFLSPSRDTRLDMTKSLFAYQADFSNKFSPYSSANMASTNKMLGNYPMNMSSFGLGNAFSMMA